MKVNTIIWIAIIAFLALCVYVFGQTLQGVSNDIEGAEQDVSTVSGVVAAAAQAPGLALEFILAWFGIGSGDSSTPYTNPDAN